MKLMILDGNSVINRAFYGVRPLTTRDGLYTNAIYGFLNILEKERSEEKPDALCVAFDLHAPTFRHLRYDGYKATRHPMPEELAMQMPVMKQVLAAMNIPVYACEGWEADDVLGTVGRLCEEAGWDCAILTGDRDSLQLVDEHVSVRLVHTQGGQTRTERYTPDVFRAEYGLEPKRLIDLKALMGDSSDNIPGVAGVGPKTANDLLKRFGTLDGVYANLSRENMKGKLFDKLENGRESAYLSYELATIRCDAPIDFTPENNLIRPPKRRALYDLFTTLEFQRLIDRYGLRSAALEQDESEEPAQPVTGSCTILDVQTPEQAQQLLSGVTLSIAAADDLSMLVAAPHMDGPDQTAYVLRRETLGTDFVPLLQRLFAADVPKTVHDSKPLLRALLALGVEPAGIVFDTAVAAYLLDATRGAYALPQLAQDYLHIPPADEASLPQESVLAIRTACIDGLTEELGKRLREQGMQPLFENIELPLCPVLARMEQAGFLVDRKALYDFGESLTSSIEQLQQSIWALAGEPFNIQSPKQLGNVLFERLMLPAGKKTKTGWSTNAAVLDKLRGKHPIIEQILDYRTLTKLKSTYADGLLKEISADGRIHTNFQMTVTATGRLSSTEPNLQNIPVRRELGVQIRKMFVASPGKVLVDADYSQIELRLLAHIANDETMIAAFRSGEDIHAVTASQVFGVPLAEVTPLQRSHAKAVNFGIVYGISAFSLAQDIGVFQNEAKAYMDSYFAKYHGVRDYMTRVVEQAKADGYVTTLFGRRRDLPELKSSNFNLRSFGERVALNMPIQGTAADIIKAAMVRVDARMRAEHLQARLLLQVHDELIVECPTEEAETVKGILVDEMEHVVDYRVPLLVDAKIGASWAEAH